MEFNALFQYSLLPKQTPGYITGTLSTISGPGDNLEAPDPVGS
jgi:hypothetical protein